MTAININRTNTVGLGLTGVVSASVQAFTTWNNARATRKALGALTNLQLDDIGLSRGDVEQIIR